MLAYDGEYDNMDVAQIPITADVISSGFKVRYNLFSETPSLTPGDTRKQLLYYHPIIASKVTLNYIDT